MKKIRRLMLSSFGHFSSLILKLTSPLVFIQAAYLLYYIYSRETFELVAGSETVYAIIESIMMSLLLSVGGSLLMEYMEKKRPWKRSFFFMRVKCGVISCGCPPWDPDQRTFREKPFGISKAFAKINGVFGTKVFADF